MSLDKESARLVHAERMVLEKMTLTAKAIERGYLDYMMGLEKPDWVDFTLESYYAKGRANGKKFRDILNMRKMKWVQRVIKKNGSKWDWVLYVEGYCIKSGTAKTERAANLECE